jgi:hypothetical protein
VRLSHRHADAAAGLIAGKHCREERTAAQAALIRDRPSRRDYDTSGMRHGIAMKIIRFQDMGQTTQIKGASAGIAAVGRSDGLQHTRWFRL